MNNLLYVHHVEQDFSNVLEIRPVVLKSSHVANSRDSLGAAINSLASASALYPKYPFALPKE
jgi:hypothetical protein